MVSCVSAGAVPARRTAARASAAFFMGTLLPDPLPLKRLRGAEKFPRSGASTSGRSRDVQHEPVPPVKVGPGPGMDQCPVARLARPRPDDGANAEIGVLVPRDDLSD